MFGSVLFLDAAEPWTHVDPAAPQHLNAGYRCGPERGQKQMIVLPITTLKGIEVRGFNRFQLVLANVQVI